MFLEPVICSTSPVVCVRDVLGACYLQYLLYVLFLEYRISTSSVVCVREVFRACYLQYPLYVMFLEYYICSTQSTIHQRKARRTSYLQYTICVCKRQARRTSYLQYAICVCKREARRTSYLQYTVCVLQTYYMRFEESHICGNTFCARTLSLTLTLLG